MGIEYNLKKMLGKDNFSLLEKLVNKVYEQFEKCEIEIVDEHSHFEIKFKLNDKVICLAIAMKNQLDFAIIYNKIEINKYIRKRDTFSKGFAKLVDETKEKSNGKLIRFKFAEVHLQEVKKILSIKCTSPIKMVTNFSQKKVVNKGEKDE